MLIMRGLSKPKAGSEEKHFIKYREGDYRLEYRYLEIGDL